MPFTRIRSIINGWYNYYRFKRLHPGLQQLFNDRLDVCNNCTSLRGNVCIECGCFVAKKTKSVLEYCPLNKWNPTVYEDDEFPSGVVIKEEIPELLQSFVSDVTSVEHWEEILTWLQKEELGVSTAEIK